jgi:hypothetical protein
MIDLTVAFEMLPHPFHRNEQMKPNMNVIDLKGNVGHGCIRFPLREEAWRNFTSESPIPAAQFRRISVFVNSFWFHLEERVKQKGRSHARAAPGTNANSHRC